jgi:RimJ/RimL family protein N-acetyltransferase
MFIVAVKFPCEKEFLMAERRTGREASTPEKPASTGKVPPSLKTRRLLLRAPRLADSPRIRRLAGDRAVASTTLLIPHPYEKGMAEQWIQAQRERQQKGREVTFAIVLRSRNLLIGVIGLRLTAPHARGELGYWIGKPYWRRGYATEAAEVVLRHGFETLGLNRICPYHFPKEPGLVTRAPKTRNDPRGHAPPAHLEMGIVRGPGRIWDSAERVRGPTESRE